MDAPALEPLTEVAAPGPFVTPPVPAVTLSAETTPPDVTPPIGPRVAPLPAPPSTSEPGPQPSVEYVAEAEVTAEVETQPEPTAEAEAQPRSATAPQNGAETLATDEPATWRDVIARIELEEPVEASEDAGESVAWEFEAMTTPDYAARRPAELASILEPDAVVPNETRAESPEDLDDLEDLIAGDTGRRSDFPLDAFIVPAGAHVPAGYESRVAHLVADQLEELAAQLRREGLSALGGTHAVDELSRVLAAIVTGYVSRGQ